MLFGDYVLVVGKFVMMWVEKVGSDIVLCVCEVGCWSVDMVLVYVVEFDMDGLEKLFVDVCVLEVLGG